MRTRAEMLDPALLEFEWLIAYGRDTIFRSRKTLPLYRCRLVR